MNAMQEFQSLHHDITSEFGFLTPDHAQSSQLPEELQQIRSAALELPYTLVTGRVRHF